VHNARLDSGDGSQGWPRRGPYDVIVATGSLPVIPDALRRQLKIGGRLAAIVGDDPVMSAEIVTRVADASFDTTRLFETRVKPLRNAERPSSFRF
jgi:protein-L-isoaspartate(D-aspartate) O-methyltransferase